MTAAVLPFERPVVTKPKPHDPKLRGYVIVYRRDQVNFCPGCGRSHWWLGRIGAECAFCCLAMHYGEAGI